MEQLLTTNLKNRAKKLAILFLDENSLPSRFKPGKKTTGRKRENSKIEIEFQKTVKEWEDVIITMIKSDFPSNVMERLLFLELDPSDEFEKITDCADWNEHLEYLIYRRDECDCPDYELGKLVMVMGEYQRLVEKKLRSNSPLKNELAQELMEKGIIELDGHTIKLWKGATRDTVRLQEDWNKVRKLGELNQHTTIENPRVCFTGMFQIPRKEVVEYASQLGFHVQTSVNKRTKLFVFGSENVSPSKVAEVITLRESGSDIELMDENAFLEMVLNSI